MVNARLWLVAAVAGAAVGVCFTATVGAFHAATPGLFIGAAVAGVTFAALFILNAVRR